MCLWRVKGSRPFYKEFKFTLKAVQLPFNIAQLVPVSLQFNHVAYRADDNGSLSTSSEERGCKNAAVPETSLSECLCIAWDGRCAAQKSSCHA